MSLTRPPFTTRGRIEQCWLFVHRTSAESARAILPATLEPVTHGGFAFWNIVVCRLSGMRPPPLPAALGVGYWHVAYRLYARATLESGEKIEGLYFVRSDCDRRWLACAGNLLSDFRFHFAKIAVPADRSAVKGEIAVSDAAAHFQIDRGTEPKLSEGSPFGSLEEAARALDYPPFALSANGEERMTVVAVKRDAAHWHSRPVSVTEQRWQFFEGRDTTPELCCEVDPIEYEWKRGREVRVKPCAS